ncbi:single-stranded-DNA-specific exonuclease RecJ [Thermus thermamylovorans]|uniref:Single-stranded-DNA-specific exonuclease RecJ n=1 Tax=Thermus thermamylovorans TaxID=2509362 RepID=A0A4Q9B812_9DEIN|nr:DHH family phosphoesterase [Thermus thermamylovorans]TBH21766.1 single-stranded-DNA-specific exonuclease RecJ [Thermus thermamylovorans]
MKGRTRWKLLPLPPLPEWRGLMRALGVGPEAALAYWHRGVRHKEDLDPPLRLLPLAGLAEAVDLLQRALREGKRIRIHGDYDADGLTGTALLLRGLWALGARAHPFIPHRLEEGYGILMDRVPEHREAAEVFLTVDCGIAGHAELRELVENGVEVLVTDHHTPKETPPPGLVLHPAYTPGLEEHPTGAGVAFLLLWALRERLGLPPPLEYADLAAVGTIADVAPLWGWNRALVREGLRRLPASATLGLRLLAEAVGYTGKAAEVAFRIAPRLNAASRLGEAEKALRLLLTEDEGEARSLVEELNRLNAKRQTIEEEMLKRLLPQADPEAKAIVLHDPEGHPGVMGIVASRILEATLRPVFLVARGKGTVRSLHPVSAVEALKAAEDLLLRFGGYREAAGFALEEARFPEFRRRMEAFAARLPDPVREVPLLGLLPAPSLLPEVYGGLKALEPFGAGNEEPLFLLVGSPEEVRLMAEGKHLAFRLEGVRVVGWRMGERALPREVEVAAALVENRWNGAVSYEAQAVDFRAPGELLGGVAPFAFPVPLPEALARARMGEGVYVPEDNPEGLAYARRMGFRLLPPEEAPLWLGLPPLPVKVERVAVALGPLQRARLAAPPTLDTPEERLATLVRRRLLLAYERGHGGLFSEALLAYWEVNRVQAAAGGP